MPAGFHYCTESGEVKASIEDDYDQHGLLRRCYVLTNPHCYEWVPTSPSSVATIEGRGVPLSQDLLGNALCAARVSLPGDAAAVVPGRLRKGECWPHFAVVGLHLCRDTAFELLCYKVVL